MVAAQCMIILPNCNYSPLIAITIVHMPLVRSAPVHHSPLLVLVVVMVVVVMDVNVVMVVMMVMVVTKKMADNVEHMMPPLSFGFSFSVLLHILQLSKDHLFVFFIKGGHLLHLSCDAIIIVVLFAGEAFDFLLRFTFKTVCIFIFFLFESDSIVVVLFSNHSITSFLLESEKSIKQPALSFGRWSSRNQARHGYGGKNEKSDLHVKDDLQLMMRTCSISLQW